MGLLTAGIPPQLVGSGGRKVLLPVKATTQIWEGALVAQISGACVPGTTANAGDAIGVAEHDMLGGASDGTKRISVFFDKIFIFPAGAAAPVDATPFGTLLYMEDDHTVGTGGLGATQKIAGRFAGLEDDGRVRVYINGLGAQDAPGAEDEEVIGTITNTASSTIQRSARVSLYRAPTLGQNTTVTIGTTGAVTGDRLRIVRSDVSAFTLALVNGGAGAGTLATIIASKAGFIYAFFDGTNWIYDGSSAT